MKRIATSDSVSVAVACAVEALADNLRRCAKCSAEARALTRRGEFDRAIGTIAGMNVLLSESIALYQAALALHCIRRRAPRGTPHGRVAHSKR